MSDYLKELLSKKNLISILILAILVLAIPLTINLARRQQILFSKAATDSVQLVDNECTIVVNGKKVLTCPTVRLKFVAPSETDVTGQGFAKTAYAQDSVATQCKGSKTWDQIDSELHGANWDGTYQHDQDELDAYNRTSCAAAPPASSPAPSPSPAPAICPVTASCCAQPLKPCGTTASFDGVSKDTSCPTGFQWCYSGYCISEKYDNKGTTGSCTTTSQVCTPNTYDAQNCRSCASDGSFWGANGSDYGTNFNSPEWCSCARRFAQDYQSNPNYTGCRTSAPPSASLTGPSSVTKQNSIWPDLSLQVSADSSTSWGVFYQNGAACTKSSCSLQGWTPIGNTGAGNATVVWPSAQTTKVLPGIHTFAVINSSNTQVLATYDVSFQGTTAPVTPNIVKVRYAENASDLTNPNLRHEITYQKDGVFQNITFVDPKVGTKFVYTQFIDDKGTVTPGFPNPFQIDLIGPTPQVSGFACDVNIASSTTPNSPSSDLLLTFQGINFGSQPGTITLAAGGTVSIDSWTDTKVVGRLSNLQSSTTVAGTSYTAILTTKDNRKAQDPQGKQEQQCLVGITQIALGGKLFCRSSRDFDQDNVELVLISDKDRNQKTSEKVTIDKEGNIANIKSKLRAGDNYIACIKAPLSVRRCSTIFTAFSGTNNISINLPIGDYNGDGAINNFDKSILENQWGPMNTNKNCDVNRDKFCNSFEWSCMLHDFNASNQQNLPSFTAPVATPTPTPTLTLTPTPSPTPDTSGM